MLVSRVEVGDQQAAAGAELGMADNRTTQRFRPAPRAVGAGHLAGENPPPRASRRITLPDLEAAREAGLLDHDHAVTGGTVVADRDTQRPGPGRKQRTGRGGLGGPPGAGPVVVAEGVTPVGGRREGTDHEYADGAEAEQVEVAITTDYRRAEYLLLRQRPEGAAEHEGRADQAGCRVVHGKTETFRGRRVLRSGDAVVVVADQQGARGGGRRRTGDPGDPLGGVGTGARAGQQAARQLEALRLRQERLRGAGARQGQRTRRRGDLAQRRRRPSRLKRACGRGVRAEDQAADPLPAVTGDFGVAEQPDAPAWPAGQRAAVAAVPVDRVTGRPLVVRQNWCGRRARRARPAGGQRGERHGYGSGDGAAARHAVTRAGGDGSLLAGQPEP
jgi:hypothetical protein